MKRLALLVIPVLLACVSYLVEAKDTRNLTFPAAPYATVSITTGNGSILADTTASDSIYVTVELRATGTTQADAQAHLADIHITSVPDTAHHLLQLVADFPVASGRSYGASFTVHVPARLGLDVSTTNGPVDIARVAGSLDLVSTNGALHLHQVAGRVLATTTNGTIEAELVTVPAGGVDDLTSTNGDATIVLGELPAGSSCRVETTNGTIDCALPDTASAHINIWTTNGGISVIGLSPTVIQADQNHLEARLGAGAADLALRTSNGGVTLRRAP